MKLAIVLWLIILSIRLYQDEQALNVYKKSGMPVTTGGMRVIAPDGKQYITVITPMKADDFAVSTLNMSGQ